MSPRRSTLGWCYLSPPSMRCCADTLSTSCCTPTTELVDGEHPIVEELQTPEERWPSSEPVQPCPKHHQCHRSRAHVFRQYFWAPQYRELHEPLAEQVFQSAFRSGVFVGSCGRAWVFPAARLRARRRPLRSSSGALRVCSAGGWLAVGRPAYATVHCGSWYHMRCHIRDSVAPRLLFP